MIKRRGLAWYMQDKKYKLPTVIVGNQVFQSEGHLRRVATFSELEMFPTMNILEDGWTIHKLDVIGYVPHSVYKNYEEYKPVYKRRMK